MSATYSDVDGSADPTEAVHWLGEVERWPQVQAYKRRIVELLAGADHVVDVGCGAGAAVVSVGGDRCVGVDRSVAMCRAAAARGAPVAVASAHALPFADGCFGGVFADRVLQHLKRPIEALAEAVRVLHRGGRLVVADPDQETLVIHVPGVRRDLVDRVKALRRDVGYRNGRLVSSLPARLPALGIEDVSVEPFPLLLTDPDDAFGLPGWLRLWRAEGGFSDDDLVEWDDGMARSRAGGFVYAHLYFVVGGVKI